MKRRRDTGPARRIIPSADHAVRRASPLRMARHAPTHRERHHETDHRVTPVPEDVSLPPVPFVDCPGPAGSGPHLADLPSREPRVAPLPGRSAARYTPATVTTRPMTVHVADSQAVSREPSADAIEDVAAVLEKRLPCFPMTAR